MGGVQIEINEVHVRQDFRVAVKAPCVMRPVVPFYCVSTTTTKLIPKATDGRILKKSYRWQGLHCLVLTNAYVPAVTS